MTNNIDELLAEKQKIESEIDKDRDQLKKIEDQIFRVKVEQENQLIKDFEEDIKKRFVSTEFIKYQGDFIIRIQLSSPFLEQYEYIRENREARRRYYEYSGSERIYKYPRGYDSNGWGGGFHISHAYKYSLLLANTGEQIDYGYQSTFDLAVAAVNKAIDKIKEDEKQKETSEVSKNDLEPVDGSYIGRFLNNFKGAK